MKKSKLSLIQEKTINKNAQKKFDALLKSSYVQNPIKAKFAAFQHAKKGINSDDLI